MISVGCNETSVEKDKGRSLFNRLFRSKPTEQKKKPQKSASVPAPKRRLVRVIRDGERAGEEYENPHVIRRYTKNYWEENNQRMACTYDESQSSLPYTVTGHTILKKHALEDNNCLSPKKATFNCEVEIFMFNHLEKTGACQRITRSLPLLTFDDESHCDEVKQLIDFNSASCDEDNSIDCVVPDELADNFADDCECQDIAEVHDDSSSSDSEQASPDCATDGRFALLVAADEKDLHVNRAKRKLSTSSGSSESSCQFELEA